ncbi:MAG: NAD-dependent epimerase/dehydratase family protein [Alphaproteobacteria bacterium]|nr:NAD-dependent epimerase/dehydratase family protein [Alphaproteobacteria bacterium]
MGAYLVTGGAGFIGSHLVEALIARGERVRVLDDLSSGKRENLPSGAELIVGDVADAALVARAMEGVRGCFHLAAIASVQRSMEEWLTTNRANLVGSIAVFDAARRQPTPVPVVYASSAAIYGDNPDMPIAESAPPAPLSAYGADKMASELHGRVAWLAHGVPTIGFRFFNVYGPRQDPNSPYSGVIAIFADRIARDCPITIFGDGEQVRDFVYVADVVRFLLAAMTRPDLAGQVFNIATGRPTSVNELARAIAATVGRPARIERAPARTGDIRLSIGNPARLNATFGFAAETRLIDGLKPTLAAGGPDLRAEAKNAARTPRPAPLTT